MTDGALEIRPGRWQAALPGTYDPARAIVITDPPFGIGGRGYEDAIPWLDHVREVLALLPARRHVIRGPAFAWARGLGDAAPRRICIELRAYATRATFKPWAVPYRWHGWGVWGSLRAASATPRGDVWAIRNQNERLGRGDHHGVTPWEAAWLAVDTWADPGGLVLDPFAGVGTIGRAAAQLGADYLGAELDPRWHLEASRKLATRQLTW